MWQTILISLLVVSSEGRYENVNINQDWWETAAIYQVYTRSFKDSDDDGIGDINGVTSRLEYLKDIGVNAVWLTSIFKSPNHDFGYDVSDYYAINPEYGTIDDFEHLLKKANERNIKVILDMVLNHSSNESEWFLKSMHHDEYYSDWYIWDHGHLDSSGAKQPPNNWVSLFRKSAWSYSISRDQFYLHQFSSAQPDLNFRSPVVIDEMKNILKFWLEKGVAGFMISSVNHLFEVDRDMFGGRYPDEPPSGNPAISCSDDYGFLIHEYTKDLDETYDLISQLREVFDAISIRDNMTRVMMTATSPTDIKRTVRYYGQGNNHGAHIPINTVLMDELTMKSDARDIKYAIDRWIAYKPLTKPATWVMGNHDKSRISSRFRGQLVDAFNMLVLLLPGIGITYMGEEIGMVNGYVPWTETVDPVACKTDDPVNYVAVSRDPARTPFQWSNTKNAGFSQNDFTWLPVADGYEYLNVDNQKSAVRSHYHVYRTLTNLRMRPAFKLGRYESISLSNTVFAFKRWYNDDTYIVVMNVGKTYQVVNLTAFDLVFGQLEVEVSSVLSSRTSSDNLPAEFLDLAADEALVLRMQV